MKILSTRKLGPYRLNYLLGEFLMKMSQNELQCILDECSIAHPFSHMCDINKLCKNYPWMKLIIYKKYLLSLMNQTVLGLPLFKWETISEPTNDRIFNIILQCRYNYHNIVKEMNKIHHDT